MVWNTFLLSLVQYTDICGLDFTYVWPGLWQLIIAFSIDSLSLNASRGGWVAKRLSSCHDVSMRLNLFTSSVTVVGGPCLRNCVQQGGVWFTTVLATAGHRQLFRYSAMCSGSWSSTGGRKHISVMWSIVGCWYTKCARTKHRITVQGFYALDITIRSPASLPVSPTRCLESPGDIVSLSHFYVTSYRCYTPTRHLPSRTDCQASMGWG